MGKFLNSQLLLSDLPAGNDGSHQNKYQVQDDEKNYHDSLQARLKGGIGDYIEWGGGGGEVGGFAHKKEWKLRKL